LSPLNVYIYNTHTKFPEWNNVQNDLMYEHSNITREINTDDMFLRCDCDLNEYNEELSKMGFEDYNSFFREIGHIK